MFCNNWWPSTSVFSLCLYVCLAVWLSACLFFNLCFLLTFLYLDYDFINQSIKTHLYSAIYRERIKINKYKLSHEYCDIFCSAGSYYTDLVTKADVWLRSGVPLWWLALIPGVAHFARYELMNGSGKRGASGTVFRVSTVTITNLHGYFH